MRTMIKRSALGGPDEGADNAAKPLVANADTRFSASNGPAAIAQSPGDNGLVPYETDAFLNVPMLPGRVMALPELRTTGLCLLVLPRERNVL